MNGTIINKSYYLCMCCNRFYLKGTKCSVKQMEIEEAFQKLMKNNQLDKLRLKKIMNYNGLDMWQ